MDQEKHTRTIRSFVNRHSRITQAQQRAVDALMPKYGLFIEDKAIDFQKIFGRNQDVIFEIGFGMGDSLAATALKYPEKDFIGVDPYLPGVGALLNVVDESQIENLRVFHGDALDVLSLCIPDESLSKVQIFFPDPWPKRRHHKRRLIQPDFIALIKRKLRKKGYLHIATDWEDYARYIDSVLAKSEFCQITDSNLIDDISFRPATKFEERGKRLSHVILDFIYQK